MNLPTILVEVSDAYMWALEPFSYLLERFWVDHPYITVAGYTISNNVAFRYQILRYNFFSIAPYNYPANRWSDGVIEALQHLPDDFLIFMMADYWLRREVDLEGIAMCYDYIQHHDDVLRMDLTEDVLRDPNAREVTNVGHYDIVERQFGLQYRLSFQASIYNRKMLLELLKPGMTAWETECYITPPENMRALGTRQAPVRYINAVNKGKVDMKQINQLPQPYLGNVLKMIGERR